MWTDSRPAFSARKHKPRAPGRTTPARPMRYGLSSARWPGLDASRSCVNRAAALHPSAKQATDRIALGRRVWTRWTREPEPLGECQRMTFGSPRHRPRCYRRAPGRPNCSTEIVALRAPWPTASARSQRTTSRSAARDFCSPRDASAGASHTVCRKAHALVLDEAQQGLATRLLWTMPPVGGEVPLAGRIA